MQDLKTGALLKASPRSQFYGQMIGSLASVFVSVGAYKLYTRIYEVSCDPLSQFVKLTFLVDSGTRIPCTNRRNLVGHDMYATKDILIP
jgi:hypothetical protein